MCQFRMFLACAVFFVVYAGAGDKPVTFNSSRSGGDRHVMVFAHRGDWRYAPENSLKAFENCINVGFDGIELDLQMTKDSVLVVIHDESLERTTTGRGKVSNYTLQELRRFHLKTPTGYVSNQKIPTFDEVLELTKGKILIMLDKWERFREQVMEAIYAHGCEKQVIVAAHGGIDSEMFDFFKKYPDIGYIRYMVCDKDVENRKINEYTENGIGGMYIAFKEGNEGCFKKVHSYAQRGHVVWATTLLGPWNGGHDDQLALDSPEKAYGELIKIGVNAILSDDPHRLLNYLRENNLR